MSEQRCYALVSSIAFLLKKISQFNKILLLKFREFLIKKLLQSKLCQRKFRFIVNISNGIKFKISYPIATSSAETENASQRSARRSDLLLRFIWLTDERNAVQPACHKRALIPPTGDGVDTIIDFYLLGATTLIYWTGEGDSPLQLVSLAKVGYFHYHLFVVSSSVYLACTAANKCMHWADRKGRWPDK